MKEIFEEYGGVICLTLIGLTVISGFIEVIYYLKQIGFI